MSSESEMRQVREDLRFARYWDARMQEPEHPLALLARAHPEVIEVVRLIARNAFTSGARFAGYETTGWKTEMDALAADSAKLIEAVRQIPPDSPLAPAARRFLDRYDDEPGRPAQRHLTMTEELHG